MPDRPISFLVPDILGIRAGRKVQARRPKGMLARCAAGDRLWIREPFRLAGQVDHLAPTSAFDRDRSIWFAADGPSPAGFGRPRFAREMPRGCHRAHLLLNFVGIEPLQAINDEGARAEGCADRAAFRDAWDAQVLAGGGSGRSITGERIRWCDNPIVTVLAFDFLDAPLDQLRRTG